MSVKFFGQYLLERGAISPEQLIEAVDFQETANLLFGDYAVSKGYLTREQASRINTEQKTTDALFGEIALETGLLSRDQINEILTRQKNDHYYIGAIMVRKGFLSTNDLMKHLKDFKEDQAGYSTGEIAVPGGVENPGAVGDMVVLTRKMLYRISRITAKVGKASLKAEEPGRNFAVVAVSLQGDPGYDYIFSCSLEASEVIASGILGSNAVNEPGEIVADAVKEFVNIVCGNIISRFAQYGRNVEISPPLEAQYSKETGYNLLRGRPSVQYPMVSTAGDMTLILAEGAVACK
ncbi:MAG: chemotaxis protein CheX [Nitrospirota bacterium]|jgi:CheY-specific phosphatase CheX